MDTDCEYISAQILSEVNKRNSQTMHIRNNHFAKLAQVSFMFS